MADLKITAKTIPTLEDGRHRIERGLYINVRGKSRVFYSRLTVDGVRREVSIGSFPKVSLQEARARNAEILANRFRGKELVETAKKHASTFGEFAQHALCMMEKAKGTRGEAYKGQRQQILDKIILPVIGELKISDIGVSDVVRVLEPIWDKHPTNSKIARSLIEKVFDYAAFEGLTDKQNPAVWNGLLELYLPPISTVHTVRHREAPTLDELRSALPRMLELNTTHSKAAVVIALTACRVREALFAMWDEFNEDTLTIDVPQSRRKDRRPEAFRIALPLQAVEILRTMLKKSPYIFFPDRTIPPAEYSTPRRILSRLTRKEVTMHGARSTFSDWAASEGLDPIVCEKCLCHATGNAVAQAYQRSDLLERRREVMQHWADTILPMPVLLDALKR